MVPPLAGFTIHISLFTVPKKQKIPPQGDGINSALPPRFPRGTGTLGGQGLMTSQKVITAPRGGHPDQRYAVQIVDL